MLLCCAKQFSWKDFVKSSAKEHVTCIMPTPADRVFETEEDMSSVFKTTKFEWPVVGDVTS